MSNVPVIESLEPRLLLAATTNPVSPTESAVQQDPFPIPSPLLLNDAGPAEALVYGDFNNDGFQDLAIGMPEADVGEWNIIVGGDSPIQNAGAVRVIYGGITGLRELNGIPAINMQRWDQDQLTGDGAESGDRFGATLVVGDFNGDEIDDLAIASPGEDGGRGAVHVLFGASIIGLRAPILPVKPLVGNTESEALGTSLAAGDFDHEVDVFGRRDDELVIGSPGANNGRGKVYIYDVTTSQFTLRQTLEGAGRFGSAAAVGDFNGDDLDDLAVGAPNKDINYRKWSFPVYVDATYTDAGVVNVFYGRDEGGLNDSSDKTLFQSYREKTGGPFPTPVKGLAGSAESYDHFGAVLAVGNFDGDDYDDLAIGVPDEDVVVQASQNVTHDLYDAGAVNVAYGSAGGLSRNGNQIFHQEDNRNSPDLPNPAALGDKLGTAIAAGDINGDRIDDLAIGVPFEHDTANGLADVGIVHLLEGTSNGLAHRSGDGATLNNRIVSADDRFGFALALGDIKDDGKADLAVSAAGQGFPFLGEEMPGGAVHVLHAGFLEDPPHPGAGHWQTWFEQTDTLENHFNSMIAPLMQTDGSLIFADGQIASNNAAREITKFIAQEGGWHHVAVRQTAGGLKPAFTLYDENGHPVQFSQFAGGNQVETDEVRFGTKIASLNSMPAQAWFELEAGSTYYLEVEAAFGTSGEFRSEIISLGEVESEPLDQKLQITLPDSAKSEQSAVSQIVATIHRSGDVSRTATVHLMIDDPTGRVTGPDSVLFEAGESSIDVVLQIHDNDWYDGVDQIAIFADATGYVSAIATADLIDDEQLAVTLVGDFDGDGSDDIAGLLADGRWGVGRFDSGGFPFDEWAVWSIPQMWQEFHAADFNGDGMDDIAGLSIFGSWFVGISDGESFETKWVDPSVLPGDRSEYLVGDFDGDNADEFAAFSTVDGTWWVAQFDESGNAQEGAVWADFMTTVGWKTHIVGDFNGDERDDIASFHPWNGTWWVSLAQESGEFQTSLWADFVTADGWTSQIVGDFNDDSRDDIANFHPWNGTWWISLAQEENGFATSLWSDYGTDSGWAAQITGDFNGDGRDDIANFYQGNGTWWVSLSREEGGFSTSLWKDVADGVDWRSHHVADFNGDGQDDVVSLDGAGQLSAGLSDGRSFDEPESMADLGSIVFRDLDRDGWPDGIDAIFSQGDWDWLL